MRCTHSSVRIWACGLAVLAVLAVSVRAAQPPPPLNFTEVDLALLEQVAAVDAQLERDGLVVTDPALDPYLARVGQAVVPPGDPPARVTWRVRVLRDSTENAFAMPNGSIYVHAGLMALLEREDELASVLAHEAAHVTHRHGYLAHRDYRRKSATASLLGGLGGLLLPGAGWGGVVAAGVLGGAAPAILVASVNGYSRELESEADRAGFSALTRAGYDPRAAAETFTRLMQRHDVQVPVTYYNDHPKLVDRIARADELARGAARADDQVTAARVVDHARATAGVARLDVALALAEGRPRTAVAVAERIVARDPSGAESFAALGDAYRALGPLPPVAAAAELTEQAQKDARKAARQLTRDERERELLATPDGKAAWDANARKAEESYAKALALDESCAPAHRGLGMLDEKLGRPGEAMEHYRRYLELAPGSPDAPRIRARVARLERGPS